MIHSSTQAFCHRLTRRAAAWAALLGGPAHPSLLGTLKLFQTPAGLLVSLEVWGLPQEPLWLEAVLADEGEARPLASLACSGGYGWSACRTWKKEPGALLGRVVVLRADEGKLWAQGVIR